MGEALFRKFCGECDVKSAGTCVSREEGKKLKDSIYNESRLVVEVMKEEGIDVSDNKRERLSEELVRWADKIVCMAQRETVPDYLLNSGKVEYWEIEDSNPESSYDFFVNGKEKIKEKVMRLAEEVC